MQMSAISRVFHDPEGQRPVLGEDVNPDFLRQVDEEGYCVLPFVIDRAASAAAREASVAAAEQAAAGGYPITWEDLDPNGKNIRIPDLLAYDPVFTDLAMHEQVTPYVAALLGRDWVLSNFSGNIALPGSGSMNAHSDQSTIMPEPWLEQNCLNAIWCLDDVDEGNGATRYLPGSHKFTRFSEVPGNPKAGMRPFEASAGSVIIMHGRMWHTSGENISVDRERCLLFALYASGYLRLQANWWQIVPAERQAEMSSDVQLRLGLGSPNRGYGAYLVSTAPQPKLGS
jgi:ectoine hydroxylase-related dioxygenase (phytanoyl-CoA dioxygenase family)